MVLTQEIRIVASDKSYVQRCAPMLPEELRVFTLEPCAIAVLPKRHFEGDIPICVDRVAASSQERLSKTAIGREVRRQGAVPRDHLSGVAAEEEPLAYLPFQLENVQRILVRTAVG